MNMLDIQALVDGIGAREARKRAETQLTLGKLIAALEGMPADAQVANLHAAHSYRGYYEDLAFERGEGTRRADALLTDCKAAMGQVFGGYKGGDYVMGALTPLWVASYGTTGDKLMALHAGGELGTAPNVW
jgi:hypothetical protein